MLKKLCIIVLLFLTASFAYADSFIFKTLYDSSGTIEFEDMEGTVQQKTYTDTTVMDVNGGFGLGLEYEKSVRPNLSLIGGIDYFFDRPVVEQHYRINVTDIQKWSGSLFQNDSWYQETDVSLGLKYYFNKKWYIGAKIFQPFFATRGNTWKDMDEVTMLGALGYGGLVGYRFNDTYLVEIFAGTDRIQMGKFIDLDGAAHVNYGKQNVVQLSGGYLFSLGASSAPQLNSASQIQVTTKNVFTQPVIAPVATQPLPVTASLAATLNEKVATVTPQVLIPTSAAMVVTNNMPVITATHNIPAIPTTLSSTQQVIPATTVVATSSLAPMH